MSWKRCLAVAGLFTAVLTTGSVARASESWPVVSKSPTTVTDQSQTPTSADRPHGNRYRAD